ncbi:uncharacterized protein [Tenebrio molitor]|jgi:RNA recognition motif-containing protein|uniref:uncharacterized protein n=1 Tax=Tenebrio molitor TaxID=7067 RepID=UPI0036248C4A
MSDSTPSDYERLYTVKVNNLDFTTDVSKLRKIFSKYGRIGDVYIVKNPVTNKSRGFGFVKYERKCDAIEAAYAMNGEVMDGRIMRVHLTDKRLRKCLARRVRRSYSSTSSSSDSDDHRYATVKVENLTYRTDERDLKKLFYHCGPIADIYVPRIRKTGLNRGFAFVRFYRKYDAVYAIESLNETRFNGRKIRIVEAKYGKPPPNRNFAHGSSPLAVKYRKHR